jgi:hypothetical protein
MEEDDEEYEPIALSLENDIDTVRERYQSMKSRVSRLLFLHDRIHWNQHVR